MIEYPRETGREYDPAAQITITLTWEQWRTVLHWLEHAVDVLLAKITWWKTDCINKQFGAATAAGYEDSVAKAEEVRGIIEKAIEQG